MSILIDTNVLLRRTQPDHLHRLAALESVARLLAQNESVYFTLQNIAEFGCVASRPVANNGLGFSPMETLAEVNKIERILTALPDSPLVYAEWKRLVLEHGITGVRVHDARLVATMNVHRVRRILTFDGADFTAYGVEVIHPTVKA
jgi:predicted nucleic acid-binding protein